MFSRHPMTPSPKMVLHRLFAATLMITALMGCASEEEKKDRRNNAFDLSGDYTVRAKATTAAPMDIAIVNESGRHDIMVSINRLAPITFDEKSAIETAGVPWQDVDAFFSNPIVLGKGDTLTLQGGENISDDGGATSRFFVCTGTMRAQNQTTFRYCLRGNQRKGDSVLRGKLELHWTQEKSTSALDGSPTPTFENGVVDMDFQTEPLANGGDNPYLGNWNLEWESQSSALDLDRMRTVLIQISGDSIRVVPDVLEVRYQGESFFYSESRSQVPATDFEADEFPTAKMIFVGPTPDTRLIFSGAIISLGQMTGAVSFVDNSSESSLGIFSGVKL